MLATCGHDVHPQGTQPIALSVINGERHDNDRIDLASHRKSFEELSSIAGIAHAAQQYVQPGRTEFIGASFDHLAEEPTRQVRHHDGDISGATSGQ